MVVDPTEFINSSICKNCTSLMSRNIKLVLQEDIDYYADLLEVDNIEEMDIYIEQHYCLIRHEDIDYVVLDCNKYTHSLTRFF